MIYKACSRCGRIHPKDYVCTKGKQFKHNNERTARIRRSGDWKQTSLDIRAKAKYLCEYCLSSGKITADNLSVHHIEKLEDKPELAYDVFNLICLCAKCHKLADEGKIPKSELKTLATLRENCTPYVF